MCQVESESVRGLERQAERERMNRREIRLNVSTYLKKKLHLKPFEKKKNVSKMFFLLSPVFNLAN